MFKAKRKAWILGISALALSSIVLGYLWISVLPREQIKHRSFSYLQQIYRELPIADQTRLVYQVYFGCTNDQTAGMQALLASKLAAEAVSSYYYNSLLEVHWNDGGRSHTEDGTQWTAGACKPFSQGDPQFLCFDLIATEGVVMNSTWFSIDERPFAQETLASSESITTINLTYHMDQTVFDREHRGIEAGYFKGPCLGVPNARWRIVNP